ncbi:hypothetical protein UFO1_0107 [Pelosinus sp. UFO1]|nr:hypothetical protein UFO1_0107 [Pelosinus sp. UFO1]
MNAKSVPSFKGETWYAFDLYLKGKRQWLSKFMLINRSNFENSDIIDYFRIKENMIQ